MLRRKPVWAGLLIALGIGIALLVLPAPARAQNPTPSRIFMPMIVAGCSREMMSDWSFEAGLPNTSWVTTSTAASNILDSSSIPSPNPTHYGAWKVWLGGSDSLTESVWQTATVPAWTTTMRMSFWFVVNTQETNPLTNDHVSIQIRNSAGVPLETLYDLWDGDWGTSWAQRVITPTGNYAGQTIQLAFFAKTDSSNPTNFFIDDVSMQIGCGQ
ncbi:MAG: hypothetical protein HY868_14390 [Chloroflexi bacterium]|nr:hypothetical protein [Chloroflexota bacterium]